MTFTQKGNTIKLL